MSAVISSLKANFPKEIIEAIHTEESRRPALLASALVKTCESANVAYGEAQKRWIAVVELLIMHGADISAEDSDPLRFAIRSQNDTLVRLLLKNNADISQGLENLADGFHRGYHGPEMPKPEKNRNVLLNLLEFGAIVDPKTKYEFAYEYNYDYNFATYRYDCIRIEQGSIVGDAQSLLEEAAKKEGADTFLIETLVNRSAHIINARRLGDKNTALHIVVEFNQDRLVKMFLEKKPNLSLTNENGDTALHIAIRNNNPTIVRLLLKAGAGIYIPNNADPKETAESLARNHINSEIAEMLNPSELFLPSESAALLHGAVLPSESTALLHGAVAAKKEEPAAQQPQSSLLFSTISRVYRGLSSWQKFNKPRFFKV